jgi:hypothetical protein
MDGTGGGNEMKEAPEIMGFMARVQNSTMRIRILSVFVM